MSMAPSPSLALALREVTVCRRCRNVLIPVRPQRPHCSDCEAIAELEQRLILAPFIRSFGLDPRLVLNLGA